MRVRIYKDHTRKGNNRRPEAYINYSGGFSLTHVLAYAAQAPSSRSTSSGPASEAILKIQTLLSLSSTSRFRHHPRSHLKPIKLHLLFLQPPTVSARIPLAALYMLSSNTTLFFVIGTFAALKKPMTYTNGVQISLETRSCVFIVPSSGGWWWRTGRREVCDDGHLVASSGNG